jgi:hypothetical protein
MTLDPLTSLEQCTYEEIEQLDDWAEKQYQTQLEGYVKRIWAATKHYYVIEDEGRGKSRTAVERTLTHRLEMVARHIHQVDRRGVAENQESDYQLDLLLTEWGAGKLIAYFGALAETEGR